MWLATFIAAIAIEFPYLGVAPSSSANASVIPQATAVLKVEGMDCKACAKGVEGMLVSINGVHQAKVDFDKRKAVMEYDSKIVKPETFVDRVNKTSYEASLVQTMKGE